MKRTFLIMISFFLYFNPLHTFPQQQSRIHKLQTEVAEESIKNSLSYETRRPLNRPGVSFKFQCEENNMLTFISDFQVNENAGPNGANQTDPAVAADANGNFIFAWSDTRNGDYDIYAQRFSSDGTAVGNNFQVNDDDGSVSQLNPAISADSSGNFVIAWQDQRNGRWDIYAQRFSSDGVIVASNFKVNEDSEAEQSNPAISCNPKGDFVITWQDSRNGWYPEIFAQQYARDGTALGNNFMVFKGIKKGEQGSPAVAMDADGNFVITWWVQLGYEFDICAQRFQSDGIEIGNCFTVNDDAGFIYQRFPSISMDQNGNFVIAWQDERNGDLDIYAQRFASDGTPVNDNFKVDDSDGGTVQEYPCVSMDLQGNFIIAWCDSRNDHRDIYFQQFSKDGTRIGGNIKINDDDGNAEQRYPAVVNFNGGSFVITWQDSRHEESDIYAQHYSSDNTPIGENVKINDDVGSSLQYYPSIATDESGDFVITWTDSRNNDGDIYAQRYSNDGSSLGGNFRINDDEENGSQGFACIAMNSDGDFIVTWLDCRNGPDGDIYAQRYSPNGTPIGGNFRVNETEGSANYIPYIKMNKSGSFIIAWLDNRLNDYFEETDVYTQFYSCEGEPIGTNIKVNDHDGNEYNGPPDIAMADDGDIILTWQDGRHRGCEIYAQCFSIDGIKVGSNIRVNDDEDTTKAFHQEYPRIAMDKSGNFVIAWNDGRNRDWDIYAQRYKNGGTPIGRNFRVNDDEGSSDQFLSSMGMDRNGNFVIVWCDERDGSYAIYTQYFSHDGMPVGGNLKVSDDEMFFSIQPFPIVNFNNTEKYLISWDYCCESDWDVCAQRLINGTKIGNNFRITNTSRKQQKDHKTVLWNNKIYTTWTDNRAGGSGYDIWANILDWENPVSVGTGQSQQSPLAFKLNQNYPNPFNPITTISYDLPTAGEVNLAIYNSLGQKIVTLLDNHQPAKFHQIFWDGTDEESKKVAAGIYFYRLTTGKNTTTKKMLFLP